MSEDATGSIRLTAEEEAALNETGLIRLVTDQPGITQFHLPGKHDQENHGHPGPGEIAHAEEVAKRERKADEPLDPTTKHVLEGAKEKAVRTPRAGSKAAIAAGKKAELDAKNAEFHKDIEKKLDEKFGEGTAEKIRKSGQDPKDYFKPVTDEDGAFTGEYGVSAKPFPGTDSWLGAHGIDKKVYEARPMKRAENPNDPVVRELYGDYGKRDIDFAKNSLRQSPGIIMVRKPYPGAEEDGFGKIVPQYRPDSPVVVDGKERAKKKAAYDRAKLVYEERSAWTEDDMLKNKQAQVKRAQDKINKMKSNTYTPEDIARPANERAERSLKTLEKHVKSTGDPKLNASFDEFKKAKAKAEKSGKQEDWDASEKAENKFSKLTRDVRDAGDPTLFEAKQNFNKANREARADRKLAKMFREDKPRALGLAQEDLDDAKKSYERAKANPAESLAAIKEFAKDNVESKKNAYEKTRIKYAFPPGKGSASRIEVNQDPQNIKNLTKGRGKVYFIMEGNIKADAALSAIKREDPTAAVVSVPSVTLWKNDGNTAELDGLAKRHLRNRDIVLVPDADGAFNDDVLKQAQQLKGKLKGSGVNDVFLAAPPTHEYKDPKKGWVRGTDSIKFATADPKEKRFTHDFPTKDPDGFDGRKGLDDHLGLGKGTLGDLVYRDTPAPKFDITKTHNKDTGHKLPKKDSVANMNRVLEAISDMSGKEGVARISKSAMSGYTGLPDTTVGDNVKRLQSLGIVRRIDIYDPKALANHRIRVTMDPVEIRKLARRGGFKLPDIENGYMERDLYNDVSPIYEILDDRYKTSPGEEKRLASRFRNLRTSGASRIVRTRAGAARYNVPIGSPIPEGEPLPATVLNTTGSIRLSLEEGPVSTGKIQLSTPESEE